jgi:adenylosuccinate synthase
MEQETNMRTTVLFGGQFGSEGKGLMASYLANANRFDLVTTDAGPNAGHTAIVGGKKVVTFHLPMMGVLSPHAVIWLNGGAVINPEILYKEIESMEELGLRVKGRVVIHPSAAVITQSDLDEERSPNGPMQKISSTQKGVGAAARRKMSRGAMVAKDYPSLLPMIGIIHPAQYRHIGVEVAQGYSLSINSGFYPHTTFRCCSPAQGLMNASIPTTSKHTVVAVIRVNPIRVGNLPDGYSGDIFSDQDETTWEALGQPPQYTTVTNRIRRVFTYSKLQVEKMIRETKPDQILVNFAQTVTSETLEDIRSHILETYDKYSWVPPNFLYGYGPDVKDIEMDIR